MNCLGCGRDTCRSSGYCYRCLGIKGFSSAKGHIHDTKDRPIIANISELDFGAAEELYDGTIADDEDER